MKIKITVILIVVMLCFAGFYIYIAGAYTAAVNWHLISRGDYNEEFSAASAYYDKAAKTYSSASSTVLNADVLRREIGRAVLDKLVENSLVHYKLKSIMSDGDLASAVNDKVNTGLGSADVNKDVQTLYGFSVDRFKDKVLKPEAEREILQSKMGEGFNPWLADARAKARVAVFLAGYSWDGQEVILKK